VVEAANSEGLKSGLAAFDPREQICAALFYFYPPGTMKWMNPEVWWRETQANVAQWLPEIAGRALEQATVNPATGECVVHFEWEQVTPRELEILCHYFDETLA
jgi:hypothetical protein